VPALTMCALQILLLPLLAGDAPLDRPLPVPTTEDVLQYDDGTAEWTSQANYKGVWFSITDFSPYAVGFSCAQISYWWHNSMGSAWWDSEIWIGGASGPESLLVVVPTSGISMVPTFVSFDPPIECGNSFWVVMDCEPMGAGRPATFADDTPNPISHSFISEDGITWEPFIMESGPTAIDLFFRAYGTLELDLEGSSWGRIKALF
jgi:hypothetical protein